MTKRRKREKILEFLNFRTLKYQNNEILQFFGMYFGTQGIKKAKNYKDFGKAIDGSSFGCKNLVNFTLWNSKTVVIIELQFRCRFLQSNSWY